MTEQTENKPKRPRQSFSGLADGIQVTFPGKAKRIGECWQFRQGTHLYEDQSNLKSIEVKKVLKFLKDPANRTGTFRVSAILRLP